MQYLLFAPLVVTLCLYAFPVYLLTRQRYSRAQDFLVASETTSPRVFQNSAIAYALQMATFGPFFAWGAEGDLWPALVNAGFFCVGLFGVYLARKPLFAFLDNALRGDTSITVHEFIARQHGESSAVRVIASVLTLTALFGLVVGEVLGVSAIVKPMLLQSVDSTYVFIFCMLALMFVYTIIAGNSGVMRSDQTQLGVAHAGLFGTALLLIYLGSTAGDLDWISSATIAIVFFLVCSIAMLVYRRGVFLDTTPIRVPQEADEQPSKTTSLEVRAYHRFEFLLNGLVLALTVLLALVSLWLVFRHGIGATLSRSITDLSFSTEASWIELLALLLLPLFYQVVDITNWQRLAAFDKADGVTEATERDDKIFRRAFSIYAIESTLFWIFMCMLGVVATSIVAGVDGIGTFIQQLMAREGILPSILLSVFITGAFAIALSTMSAIFSASLCAIRYDILPAFRKKLSPGQVSDTGEADAQRWTITIGILLYFVIVLGFYIAESSGIEFGTDSFLALLFAFYCAQLSFVPLIVGPIVKIRGSYRTLTASWAIVTLLVGAASGVTALVLYIRTGDDAWLWGAVPICLLSGFLTYAAGRIDARVRSSLAATKANSLRKPNR